MPNNNLNDILVFVAVVDSGSFVAGGKVLGLSRSAAGKAITRLEDRLGTRLLHRTTRTLSLTDEGRVFYEQGRKVLSSIEDAEASVAGPKGAPRGVLRLTVPNAFGRLVLLPLLQSYLAAWPDVQLEMSLSDRVADIVEEGFDLAIRIGVSLPDTQLVSRTLLTSPTLLCAAPAYLKKRGEPQQADDLAAHDCLVFTSRNQRQPWRFRNEADGWIKVQGRSQLRLDSGEAIRDAALQGLGVALLPDFLVAQDLAEGRLKRLLPRLETDALKISAVYPSKRLLEPRVRTFIDHLVAQLGPQGKTKTAG